MAEKNGKIIFWVLTGVGAIACSSVGLTIVAERSTREAVSSVESSLGDHEKETYGHAGVLVIQETVKNTEVLLNEVRGDVKKMMEILIRLDAKSTP